MTEMIKNYLTSVNVFMDLFFIGCLYVSIIVYVPHLFRSLISGVLEVKIGVFDIRARPFKYILMMIFSFLYFSLFLFGAFAIAWTRYLGY